MFVSSELNCVLLSPVRIARMIFYTISKVMLLTNRFTERELFKTQLE